METSKKLTNILFNNDVNNCTKNNTTARVTSFVIYQIDILFEGMNLCQRSNDSVKRSQVANKSSGDDPFDLQAAWSDIQQKCAYNAGKATTYSISYIDNPIGTADAIRVAINAPGGKVYLLPYNSMSTVELDTITDTTTVLSSSQTQLSRAPKIYGACYVDNAIYGMSFENKAIYKFDLHNKTYSQLATVSNHYWGICYGGDGYIYSLTVDAANKILRYKISGNTVEELSGLTTDNNKYQRLLLHPNGKIYSTPQYYTKIIELDPGNIQNPTYFSTYIKNSLHSCLLPNGDIAIAPWESVGTKKFAYANVTTKTVTFEPNVYYSGNTWAWDSNIVLTPTGKPLTLPQSFPNITEYDTLSNQITNIASTIYSASSNANYYHSGILAANNCIYCCPGGTANVKILKISIDIDGGKYFKESTILSPFLNKY